MNRIAGLIVAAVCVGAAAPALAATPPYVTVRFDLLSPTGTRCQMLGEAPATEGDLLGRPYLRGLPVDRAVACTAADGRSFGLNTLRDPRDPLAGRVDVIVVDRAGKAVPMLMVQADSQDEPLPVSGNATSLAPAAR